MFQKFSVSLPAHLIARVTERIDYDTYLMRNPEILDDLTKVCFYELFIINVFYAFSVYLE